MFSLNIFGSPKPLNIYLVKTDGAIIGAINDIIDESSVSLTLGINQQYTLDFTVVRKPDRLDWYDHIHEGMYLLVEKIGLFKMTQPSISLDGVKEYKTVSATSCESELEDKTCTIGINLGLQTSMEYLVSYDANETEVLINPYTGIPYDWIVIHNMFPEQLTDVLEKYSDNYYGQPDSDGNVVVTNEHLIEELGNLFRLIPRLMRKIVMSSNPDGSSDSTLIDYVVVTYDSQDGEVVTSYTLTSDFSVRVADLILYYTKYRKQLSLLDLVLENTGGAWTVGDIYGVSNGDYTLANAKYQFDINETIYSFLTQTLARTTNCVVSFDILNRKVNITPVEHIGSDTGIVMSYDTLVNSLNISSEENRLATRLKVSGGNNLSIARVNFGSDYVEDIDYKMNAVGPDGERIYVSDALATKYANYKAYKETQRQQYIQLSKDYEECLRQIDEIKNRLPNDGLKTDWGTFTQQELRASLTSYKNLLAVLTGLYKEDYGDAGLNPDKTINENFIKTTPYWWDYYAYKNCITEIECALEVFPYYDDTSKWTSAQITQYLEAIKAWETEWSLYGTVELQAKIESYKQNMDVLAEEAVIRVDSALNPDGYVIKTWTQLSDAEKALYGANQALYRYDIYMEYYNNFVAAQAYLNTLQAEVDTLEARLETISANRETIVSNVALDNNFTTAECVIIHRLYRDATYSNENILSTSLDSSSEKIDRMYELLEDAAVQASISSRPQLTFSVEADNLLGLDEFIPLWSSFIPGNYMLVQYRDNTYIRLRMVGYTFNPCLPSSHELTINFSNFVRSKSYYNDWASLIGKTSSAGGSSSVSSSGYGSGGNGASDLDIAISDTMLARLLSSETFGSRVRDIIVDTIDVGTLSARSATFGGLANGSTTINGQCIRTGWIVSADYNGTGSGAIDNTDGSILNLNDGKFNFGGGALTYDGNGLYVRGDITTDSITTTGSNGLAISDSNGDVCVGITTDGMTVYGDSTQVASFGADGVVIGKTDGTETYMELGNRSMKIVDQSGVSMFEINDIHTANGVIVDTFTGDGTRTTFPLSIPCDNTRAVTATVNDVATQCTLGYAFQYYWVDISPTPPADATIEVTYYARDISDAWNLTFGSRKTGVMTGGGSVAIGSNVVASGLHSSAFGVGTEAMSPGAMAIGYYNDNVDTDDLFIVGNGTSDTGRSNAFRVNASGDVYFGGLQQNLGDTSIANIGDGTVTGAIAKLGHTSISDVTWPDTALPNNSATEICEVSLLKGSYILTGVCRFAANATGRRTLLFSRYVDSAIAYDIYALEQIGASQSGVTYMQLTWPVEITVDDTLIYLNASQNSGGSLNIDRIGIKVVALDVGGIAS